MVRVGSDLSQLYSSLWGKRGPGVEGCAQSHSACPEKSGHSVGSEGRRMSLRRYSSQQLPEAGWGCVLTTALQMVTQGSGRSTDSFKATVTDQRWQNGTEASVDYTYISV